MFYTKRVSFYVKYQLFYSKIVLIVLQFCFYKIIFYFSYFLFLNSIILNFKLKGYQPVPVSGSGRILVWKKYLDLAKY